MRRELAGMQFGYWEVLKLSKNKDGRERKWICRCKCGTIKEIRGSSLTRGNSKSCGCLNKEIATAHLIEVNKRKPYRDLTGNRYGKLIVVEKIPHKANEPIKWLCKCDCGGTRIAKGTDLNAGRATQCGCETIKKFSYRQNYPRLYRIWENAKDRCSNPRNGAYERYGERGISMCQEWANSFENFCKWALDNNYSDELTIDRIDNNIGYSPDNCRWTNIFVQANNTRRNRYLTYNGEKHSISEWSRIYNINRSTADYRIKHGWSFEDAFEL